MAGGRMSEHKFGDRKGSLANTMNLPGADAELARRYYENRKEYMRNVVEYEAWAANGFVSGYSTTEIGEGGDM